MLHPLLLTLLSLTAQPTLDAPEPRERAAQLLREALEDQRAATLATWISTTQAAIGALGPGAFAASLAESLEDARWRALGDREEAGAQLARELRVALGDLDFEPLLEAELPSGFPAPTPVRAVELKPYPAVRLARADMRGAAGRGAFWKLFQHIESNGIAMTAPVETTYALEEDAWRETSMAFLYGSPDVGDATTRDGDVEVLDVEPAWFLSIGCRGAQNDESLATARARLAAWIAAQDELEVAGPLRSMGYNSPMVPRARRYFEVQIPMKKRMDEVVLDFAQEDAAERWSTVNDGVMGGLSSSRFEATGEGSCVFSGSVSLENNGGFASVRTRPSDLGLAGARALRLAFRGDGQTYKLRLRTSDTFDGVNYELVFPTEEGVWQERSFAFEDFVPVWRGRRVRDAGALRPESVRSVGLMISDEQAGPFRLEVRTLSKE